MTKTKRPTIRTGDTVRLADHVSNFPSYADKPAVTRATELRVSSITGKGTTRAPWSVSLTDGTHFWHVEPGDVVAVGA